ncbi:ankyrin repeat and SOCS box protein 15 [Elysia marginata]|uniref:Ankyrin repeat and SOCS box protein 15 n=1 Tax=Elysia marginata TaxID=1093978 RepID=A0AAV4HG85_9GAST|nr:ankyrin repeat and SOCS box protein 15 [Elysia marginata]
MVEHLIRAGGSNVDETNKMGATALMSAVALGRHEAVKVFLEAGADINRVDCNGKSVFQFAIGTRMALILINRGASVDVVDKQGHRAIDWAANVGHLSMLRLLLGVDCKRPSLDILKVPRVVQVMDSIPVFNTWIREELGNPRELKRICRGAIRDILGPSGLPQVDRLPIPRLMKDFLLAKKIDLSIGGISMEKWQKTAGGEGMYFMPRMF